MSKKILYKVSRATKAIQTWAAYADGSEIVVEYGQLGGAITEQRTQAEAKNVGKANETSPEVQAFIEVKALYKSQKENSHYFDTIEEAQADLENGFIPQKIHNYKDYGHKLPKVLLSSVKVNGSRACIWKGQMLSKIGRPETVKVPQIAKAIECLADHNIFDYDCEIYAHGLSLQRIRSAILKPLRTDKEIVKMQKDQAKFIGEKYIAGKDYLGYNPNDDAPQLKLWMFDIPTKEKTPFKERLALMVEYAKVVQVLGLSDVVNFLFPIETHSDEDRMQLRDAVVSKGFEGLVHYDPEGVYEEGKRTYLVQKSKPRYDAEAKIIGLVSNKKGESTLHMQGSKALNYVKFKLVPKGTHEERLYENWLPFVGQWMTFSYEELSDKGVPTKPVGEQIRQCNDDGEPIE